MRTRTKAVMATVGVVTAGLVASAPAASGDHQSSSSAYGVSLGGTPGQPAVTYDGGEPQSGGGQLPAELGPLASGGVLALTAADDHATSKVTDLTLGAGLAAELPQELKDGIAQLTQACTVFDQAEDANQAVDPLNGAIDQIPGIGTVVDLPTAQEASAFCNALLDADILSLARVGTLLTECDDKTGSVTLTDVEVLGAEQPVLAGEVAPETQLLPAELADAAKITLNHQTTEGENFTVEGLRVELGGQVVAVVASATCGGPIAHAPEVEGEEELPAAPAPTSVRRNVPVTG